MRFLVLRKMSEVPPVAARDAPGVYTVTSVVDTLIITTATPATVVLPAASVILVPPVAVSEWSDATRITSPSATSVVAELNAYSTEG